MKTYVSYAALGCALVVGAPVANAQVLVTQPYETFITQPSGMLIAPMPLIAVSAGVVQPIQTVQTIETVRTIRPVVRPIVRRQIVTRQTIVRRVAAATYSRPLYDYAGSAPAISAPAYHNAAYYDYDAGYARPLYNSVATPMMQTVAAPVVSAPVATAVIAAPAFRYVYQWDRILVIDPSTGLAVQTLWR